MIKTIPAIMAACLALGACGRATAPSDSGADPAANGTATTAQADKDRDEPYLHRNDETALWQDRRTGCWYVLFTGYKAGGITPRMDGGKQLCEDPPGGKHPYSFEVPEGEGRETPAPDAR